MANRFRVRSSDLGDPSENYAIPEIWRNALMPERRLPPFDLRLAMDTLAAKDLRLAPLIKETEEFRIETDGTESPYEVLMESIAYQSISGKAAATIFGRVKALGSNGRAPTPEQMLKLRRPVLRKAGLSG